MRGTRNSSRARARIPRLACAWNEDVENVQGKDFKIFSNLNDALADHRTSARAAFTTVQKCAGVSGLGTGVQQTICSMRLGRVKQTICTTQVFTAAGQERVDFLHLQPPGQRQAGMRLMGSESDGFDLGPFGPCRACSGWPSLGPQLVLGFRRSSDAFDLHMT